MDGSACYFSGSHICADAPIKEKKKKGYLIGKTSSHISKFYGRPRWDSTPTPPTKKKKPTRKTKPKTQQQQKMVMSKLDFFQIGTEVTTIFYSKKFWPILDGMGEGRKILFYFIFIWRGGKKACGLKNGTFPGTWRKICCILRKKLRFEGF